MSRKIVFVTGAGRGIGRAIALKLAQEKYVVTGCSRSLEDMDETVALSKGKVISHQLDVRNEFFVKDWINSILDTTDETPWGLICAAGVQGPMGKFTDNSFEDWKICTEMNLFGSALVSQIFSQTLLKRKLPGRIVLLSGGGATNSRPYFSAYAAAKTALVRFGETLAEELKTSHITVNSIAPGAVNTSLTEEVIKAGPQKIGQKNYDEVLKQKASGGTSPDKAANLCSYLMSEKSSQVTGKLISAVWDNWNTLHEKANALNSSDIFTLRRIVPEDRPKEWNS